MTGEQKLCDNCLSVIFGPICEICGYDNGYQFYYDDISSRIYDFITSYSGYDEDTLIVAIVEEYGIEKDRVIGMVENYISDLYVTSYIAS